MAKPRFRLDALLLERGWFDDLKTAQGWIASGKVVVDGAVVTTSGSQVSPDIEIHLRGRRLRFATRGGYTLERAIQRFGIEVAGRVCLDAGASAGGFTDCLLQHGAARVYAVDVGYGLIKGKLAADPRVQVFEKTNIGELTRQTFAAPIDLACADLSYLSLQRALPILRGLFEGPYDITALIKPSFEGLGSRSAADAAHLGEVLTNLFDALARLEFRPTGVAVSPILGGHGAIEFLARFREGEGLETAAATRAALADLANHPPQPDEAGL